MEKALARKTALVTGGTSGIGKAVAAALAYQGATVHVVGRDGEKGRAVERALREVAAHERVHFVPADLALVSEARALVGRLPGDRLDYVVQSAGVVDREPVRTPEGHNRMFVVDYLHRRVLAEATKPLLDRAEDARMVVVAAAVPDAIQPDWANLEGARVYAGFKRLPRLQAANLLMVQALAAAWAPTVAVSAVGPGLVDTPRLRSGPGWLRLLHPLLHPFLHAPETVAELVVWLLTAPEARSLSGWLVESPTHWERRHRLARPPEAVERLERITRAALDAMPPVQAAITP